MSSDKKVAHFNIFYIELNPTTLLADKFQLTKGHDQTMHSCSSHSSYSNELIGKPIYS